MLCPPPKSPYYYYYYFRIPDTLPPCPCFLDYRIRHKFAIFLIVSPSNSSTSASFVNPFDYVNLMCIYVFLYGYINL